MTTAHRPTFDPARGKEAGRGEAYHQRLLPAYKTLKFRQPGQGNTSEQARRDLRAELLKAERIHFAKKDGREDVQSDGDISAKSPLAIEEGAAAGGTKRKLKDDSGSEHGAGQGEGEHEEEDYETKKRRVLEETKDIDASDSGSDDSSSSSSESEDEDDEDDTAALMAELARIKAERAEQAAKDAAERARKEEEQREIDIAVGNPLLNPKQDYGVKRRWDDDVVFKNQARGTEERGKERRFVNDLLRSDFHRKFMDKYVR